MKAATCPICKINLSFSVKDKCRYCSSCKREFWPIQEQQKKDTDDYLRDKATGTIT